MSEKSFTAECLPGRSLSRDDSKKRVEKKKKKHRAWNRESAWIPHPGNVGRLRRAEEPNHLKKSKRRGKCFYFCHNEEAQPFQSGSDGLLVFSF